MNHTSPVKGRSFSRALRLLGALGAFGLAASILPSAGAFSIGVDIHAGPPAPRHEVMAPRPGPDYVWIDGYWAGEPGHYTWVAGRWDRPPHPGARWVRPRWEHRGDHYVFVRGGWR
jgi:hypothetical protein